MRNLAIAQRNNINRTKQHSKSGVFGCAYIDDARFASHPIVLSKAFAVTNNK